MIDAPRSCPQPVWQVVSLVVSAWLGFHAWKFLLLSLLLVCTFLKSGRNQEDLWMSFAWKRPDLWTFYLLILLPYGYAWTIKFSTFGVLRVNWRQSRGIYHECLHSILLQCFCIEMYDWKQVTSNHHQLRWSASSTGHCSFHPWYCVWHFLPRNSYRAKWIPMPCTRQSTKTRSLVSSHTFSADEFAIPHGQQHVFFSFSFKLCVRLSILSVFKRKETSHGHKRSFLSVDVSWPNFSSEKTQKINSCFFDLKPPVMWPDCRGSNSLVIIIYQNPDL